MEAQLSIQNRKIELIQKLSVIEDLNFLDKIADFISHEKSNDWWDEISVEEKKSVEIGLKQANEGKLNPHEKARAIYGRR